MKLVLELNSISVSGFFFDDLKITDQFMRLM